ncbi:MAG: carboxypeptidase-like regulatory domain-containing protein [Chitinophagales bacterium]|nr:carboxypeptidase-like regulatory domain-containing protein [Chitinophagales bacterium]
MLSIDCFSQLNFDFQEGKFLIKGTVVDLQTKRAIPLANIKVNSSGRGVTCDGDGNFSMYVAKSDTLKFSSVGYIAKVFHVYDLDSTKYYTLQIELLHDFIKLKEVTIYPFSTKEEFVDAFMDAKNVGKIKIEGIAEPKYSNVTPKAKFTNPVSFLYERVKRKRAADPEFKP